jgi:hypothetical protein
MDPETTRPARARRYAFAAGDYLTRFPFGSEFSLLIESPFEKRGWKPRTSSSTGVLFPGSAIRFEEQYYEIFTFEAASSFICYYLKPWDDRFPIRVQFDYSRQECLKVAEERNAGKRQETARGGILLLAPLAGLLPEVDQYRVQNEFGIQATRLTLISAVACLFPGGAASILLLAEMLGGDVAQSHIFLYLAGCYLFLESLVRLYTSMKLEEPMGSLLAWIPMTLVSTIVRIWNAKKEPEAYRDKKEILPLDVVQEAQESGYDLEIMSVLPKPHWSVFTGIHFHDKWYGVVDSNTLTGPKSRKAYRFLLKEAPEGFCFRNTCEYREDEARRLQAERYRADRLTWVSTFAWLWGLLSERDQERLAELYDFDALKFTRITFIALGLLGFFNLAASLLNIASHRSRPADIILLIPALYLLLETYERWKQWRAGRPAGSLLGLIARPFAKRLLE